MINSMIIELLMQYRQISVSPSVTGLESHYPSQAVTAIAFDVAPTANPAPEENYVVHSVDAIKVVIEIVDSN